MRRVWRDEQSRRKVLRWLRSCADPGGGTRRAWAAMLLDRNAPGDAARARDLIATGHAEAEQLGMARELVRFERLEQRLP